MKPQSSSGGITPPLDHWKGYILQLHTSNSGICFSYGPQARVHSETPYLKQRVLCVVGQDLKQGYFLQLWNSNMGTYGNSGAQVEVLTPPPDPKWRYILKLQTSSWGTYSTSERGT
ncbi:hypothetical protein O181_032493 [Austropuccinia psidii MF-1]|uniref:Uncharacterized protein n=1 Tax=Austropuccinia psidii MF-1 TaxID=1389203 RepID=A0A9Q3D1Q1_9BASI|nr:hypothetical protein [Austropuccinia psidii MF-1]